MALPAERGGPETTFWVMHPERCMESRIYNVQTLPGKATGLGIAQLRVSVACARDWTRRLLDQDDLGEHERQRAALRLNERVFRRCLGDRAFRGVYLEHEVDPFDAVVADHPILPERFGARRYPQMHELLEERRRADRRNRRRAQQSGAKRRS